MDYNLRPGECLLLVDQQDGRGFLPEHRGRISDCKRVYYARYAGYAARVLNSRDEVILEAEAVPDTPES